MREDQHQFMRLLGRLPARLTAEQVAWVINCQPADVPILVSVRLLKPLGNPLPSSVKFFAASELLEQIQDRTWLAKVTNALNHHWQKRNAAKKNGLQQGRVIANQQCDKTDLDNLSTDCHQNIKSR
jgi:hypothetical protein